MTGVLLHVLDNRLDGRFNAVSPGIVSHEVFVRAFARHLRRPVTWRVPAWLVDRVVGTERSSILLEGQLVRPKRTLESGFRFRFATIDEALDDLIQVTL